MGDGVRKPMHYVKAEQCQDFQITRRIMLSLQSSQNDDAKGQRLIIE